MNSNVKTEKLSLKILLMHVVQRCETTLNYLEIREDTKNTTFFLTTCLVSMHFCKLIVVFSQMHFCVKPINKESLLKLRIRWGLKRWFSNICIHKKCNNSRQIVINYTFLDSLFHFWELSSVNFKVICIFLCTTS